MKEISKKEHRNPKREICGDIVEHKQKNPSPTTNLTHNSPLIHEEVNI